MAVQFGCVGVMLLTGPVVPVWLPARLLLAGAVLLGLWAVFSMGLGRFRISPYLHPSGRLLRTGPYRFVRHPMYLALILAMLALLVDRWSALRIGAWLTLIAVLVLKLRLEERLLATRFPGYARYARTTFRILPYLY